MICTFVRKNIVFLYFLCRTFAQSSERLYSPKDTHISKSSQITLTVRVKRLPQMSKVCSILSIEEVFAKTYMTQLVVQHHNNFTGYIFPPGYDGVNPIIQKDYFCSLQAPKGTKTVLNFIHFDIMNLTNLESNIRILTKGWENQTTNEVNRINFDQVMIFNISSLKLYYYSNHISSLKFDYHSDSRMPRRIVTGFKMRFSLVLPSELPEYSIALQVFLECNRSEYEVFMDHVKCNFKKDCDKGVDELDCPFTSPQCNGDVSVGDHCFAIFDKQSNRMVILKNVCLHFISVSSKHSIPGAVP